MADLVVVAANVENNSPGSGESSGLAGASINAGQSVYKDSTDSDKLKLADADTQTPAEAVGIALHDAEDGQPLTYQASGTIELGVAPVDGEVYVVSTTAGGIAPIGDLGTGDFVTILGFGDGTNLVMNLAVSGLDKA